MNISMAKLYLLRHTDFLDIKVTQKLYYRRTILAGAYAVINNSPVCARTDG